MDDPGRIVRDGYDRVSRRYRRADFDFEESGYARFLGWIGIVPGWRVLDIGCGCGVPVARELQRLGCAVLGVDVSGVQIERARELVPGAEFVRQDITEATFPPRTFDLVVAFYSLIHVPLADQEILFPRIGSWTKPRGLLLCSLSDEHAPGYVEKDWLGVPGGDMFWSHATRETYSNWLSDSGFDVLREGDLVDSDGSRHPVVLARRRDP